MHLAVCGCGSSLSFAKSSTWDLKRNAFFDKSINNETNAKKQTKQNKTGSGNCLSALANVKVGPTGIQTFRGRRRVPVINSCKVFEEQFCFFSSRSL